MCPISARISARDFNVETLADRHDVVDSLMRCYRITHGDPLVREIDANDKVIEHLRLCGE